MNIDIIRNRIKNRLPIAIDIKKKYSVMIPIIERNNRLEILYEVRSKDLKTQPGEISFPGGKVEQNESFEEGAIRETMEELNIERDDIEIIGELDYLVSYSNMIIHCFLGKISNKSFEKINPNKSEVDHIFTVPLDYFLNNDPEIYYLDLKTVLNDQFPYNLIPNGREYNWKKGQHIVMFYNYNKYVIWGFTARMTNNFIEIIKGLDFKV